MGEPDTSGPRGAATGSEPASGGAPRGATALLTDDATPGHSTSDGTVVDRPDPRSRRATATVSPGAGIGRFSVLSVLGKGGMGVVYAAYDPELDRRVAIKLLSTKNRKSRDSSLRLLREAQAMARLSHPNVVSVYDVGELDDQTVFLAMEYVDGLTLQPWLKVAPRSWPQIRDIFIQAGRGLAAAHERGLVHRDFKPANLLIGADGRARVTDFGIARLDETDDRAAADAVGSGGATASGSTPLSVDLTRTGIAIGTPAYMAPEQHRGQPVDPRADQFAFCVTAWEAIYGDRPFPGVAAEILRAVKVGPATPKDLRGAPSWLAQVLRRGLAESPAERWPSMDALLARLGDDRAARRRKRIALSAGLVAIAGITAGTAFALTRDSRDELCQAGPTNVGRIWNPATKDRVHAAFVATGRPYAETSFATTARTLDVYARDLGAMHVEACEATRVHGHQSDEVLSLRMGCLDQRMQELSALTRLAGGTVDAQFVQRAPTAASALTHVAQCADVTALKAPIRKPRDPKTETQRTTLLAQLALAKVQRETGQLKPGLESADKALALAKQIDDRPLLAEAQLLRGTMLVFMGKTDDGRAATTEGLLAAEASRHDRVAAEASLVMAHIVGYVQDRPADAQLWLRLGEAIIERGVDDDGIRARWFSTQGVLAARDNRMTEAISRFEIATEFAAKGGGRECPAVFSATTNTGAAYSDYGQPDMALERFERALAIKRKTGGEEHPDMALLWSNIGTAHVRKGDYAKGQEALGRSIAIREREFGKDSRLLVDPSISIAEASLELGEVERATKEVERALAIATKAMGPEHQSTALAQVMRGVILASQGKLDEADRALEAARAVIEKDTSKISANAAALHEAYAEVRLKQLRFADALEHVTKAIAIREKANYEQDQRLGKALALAGMAQLGLSKHADAVATLQRAIAILEHGSTTALKDARDALARAKTPATPK